MYTRKMHYNQTKDRLAILGKEFNSKVQYDFTRLLFIGVQPQQVKYLSEVVELASNQNGYQCHRTITFRENVCHLYVRYSTTSETRDARDFFRNQDGFYSELVDDILKAWYGYEMTSNCEPRHTTCFLDVVGEVSHTQPLTEETATSLLMKFGKPIIQYVQSDHVRVSFSSIAEGIGACIVYGKWFVKHTPQDTRFHYRVQLEQSDYFTQMVNHSNNTYHNSDSLQLEYFSPKSYTQSEPGPFFSYENTGPNNNYMPIGEARNSRHFYRGRGSYKFQRGNKMRLKNNLLNKLRGDVYQQDYSQIDPTIGVQFVHQASNHSAHSSAESFHCG